MLVEDGVIGLQNPEQAASRPAPIGPDGDMTLQDAYFVVTYTPRPDPIPNFLQELITTYHDLNPSQVTTLDSEPSPLEFMRYVARNTPFVVRGGASSFPACKKWNTTYLTTVMSNQTVNVALTPHGNADSIITLAPNNTNPPSNTPSLFVKPYETTEAFPSVLTAIRTQELNKQDPNPPPTRYAQTQNDNLRNEYATLFADVPKSIPFAHIALEKDPDAINFWLGNSYSTTALHKDNYENIYVQVLGRKHFVLLPPVEAPCVNERAVLAATYAPRPGMTTKSSEGLGKGDLCVVLDEPSEYVPFATWDPDEPMLNATPYSRYSRPLRVTLEQGDMLYLPALWYHKVSQSCNEEGVCCAVNYWYDLDFSGGFWSAAGFMRSVGLVSLQNREEHGDEDQVEGTRVDS
ncbi:Clavaminate synthase-like protein [Plenodomus tracheiphilus IPT5]|uniref:Clavaminate synthase-like protein n=1 Tax=Plenodomus tracheiphilus IPT5 TaxID=1408161 RepID=A0A6A7B962_9PLEO|nr:Clavaminate synthase-like protein [Plenodomus tracheiphilus IPT5]